MKIDFTEFVNEATGAARKRTTKLKIQHAGLAAAVGVATGESTTLCQVWPTVKAGLQILKSIVPGWAAWLIDAVIALGDKLCP